MRRQARCDAIVPDGIPVANCVQLNIHANRKRLCASMVGSCPDSSTELGAFGPRRRSIPTGWLHLAHERHELTLEEIALVEGDGSVSRIPLQDHCGIVLMGVIQFKEPHRCQVR